jgi:hypothetical protein
MTVPLIIAPCTAHAYRKPFSGDSRLNFRSYEAVVRPSGPRTPDDRSPVLVPKNL